jgi:predicted RNA-binding Zn-ribbon protein involved in translation (DUF1610 family)
MKQIGKILIVISIIGLIYFSQMDTSVKVSYPNGKSFGLPERVNNIGLINDKQNYIIVSGILFISGIMLVIFGKKQDNHNNSINENSIENNSEIETDNKYYCQKCGDELYLDKDEIKSKKFICPNCNNEQIIL